ncbi:hypothetical protein [Nonomuraea sp. LPB2021202275-12-8]|uniref:hypothetical protein n=1 Tax=Nonomuraea sp. LPB2021202275-12-8 TaxID=3120159 RepID=UPI00300C67E0
MSADSRQGTAAKHLAVLVETLGRFLATAENGRWDAALDRLMEIRERSMFLSEQIAPTRLDPVRLLTDARALIPQEWADRVLTFVLTREEIRRRPEEEQ